MPTAPLRPCRVCRKLGCVEHTRQPWDHARPVQRIAGRKLQRLRQRLFDRQPLCVLCEQQGRVTIATIRDHVIPLAEGGRDDESNTQAVCGPCNRAKAAEEARRGLARAR